MRRAPRGGTGKTLRFFEPRPADKLCSADFEENMFERNFLADFVAAGLMSSNKKPAKKLVPGAVPTLFKHSRLARIAEQQHERRRSLHLKRTYSQSSDAEPVSERV